MRAILKSPPSGWLLGGFSMFWEDAARAVPHSAQAHASTPNQNQPHSVPAAENGIIPPSIASRQSAPRRTPRRSLIVVLPENHVLSPDVVSERLASEEEPENVDVILACAGQPNGIGAIQRRVRDLQVLLAPAGTSGEDLRQLAMEQAPGDIVTLVSGNPAHE